MNTTLDKVLGWAWRLPDQPAVVEDGHTVTFAGLLDLMTETVHRLKKAGVGPGALVAISCTRRAPAIAGMLAAWSLGAAYLPLMPSMPKARADLILDTARPAAILGDAADPAAPAVVTPVAGEPRLVDPSTAYVIFTSGSTGTPKGVVLGHEGLDALTRWHGEVTDLGPTELASQVADLTFDASAWEIWGTLANGAGLVVPTLDDLLEPAELLDFLLRNEIRAAFVPTGLVPGLLDEQWPARVPLRVLFTGGDRLTRWPAPRHPFRMINAYGPTECTVVASCHPLAPREGETQPPPIGHPLPHVRIRVAGPDGEAVAAGGTGELWLAGPALALGYLGAAATDRAFVTRDGERWYRTGDLVTEDAAGAMHYVSRMDHQVQIGGRRTEPAEIVRAILDHEPVDDAVVFARETASGQPRLAAAVVPATVNPGDLQRHLERLLPLFMIPSDILPLPALPLTGHGKIDIAGLRAACAEVTR